MKKIFFLSLSCLLIISSCQKESDHTETKLSAEYDYIRLLVNDTLSGAIRCINPKTNEVQNFDLSSNDIGSANLYTSASKRYGFIIADKTNTVKIFDAGIESHGDHYDIDHAGAWSKMSGNFNKPIHFYSHGELSVIFNDGTGGFSLGKEADYNTDGSLMTNLSYDGGVANHGALAMFNNHTIAITKPDVSISGRNQGLPQRVLIVDTDGKTIYNSPEDVFTKGIHGEAGDGENILFGCIEGVLIVNKSGTQHILPNPTSWAAGKWMGTLWYSSVAKKYYGRISSQGVYEIDINTNEIKPIFESANIQQVNLSYDHKTLSILMNDGTVKIYDATTLSLKKEGKLFDFNSTTPSKQRPYIIVTDKYMYATAPKIGKIEQFSLITFDKTNTFDVSNAPYRITALGFLADKPSSGHTH